MKKCSFGDGITIKPDGINELDPCTYQDIQMFANVTVLISKCTKCGHVEISWFRQDDTEEIPIENNMKGSDDNEQKE